MAGSQGAAALRWASTSKGMTAATKKADGSAVTRADALAQRVILRHLHTHLPGVALVAEEDEDDESSPLVEEDGGLKATLQVRRSTPRPLRVARGTRACRSTGAVLPALLAQDPRLLVVRLRFVPSSLYMEGIVRTLGTWYSHGGSALPLVVLVRRHGSVTKGTVHMQVLRAAPRRPEAGCFWWGLVEAAETREALAMPQLDPHTLRTAVGPSSRAGAVVAAQVAARGWETLPEATTITSVTQRLMWAVRAVREIPPGLRAPAAEAAAACRARMQQSRQLPHAATPAAQ